MIPAFAAGAALLRWVTQGSHNLYTAQAKRFFVPNVDLGWEAVQTERVWLGLDAIGILAISAMGVVLAAYLIARRERQRQAAQPVARTALALGALMSWVVPGAAFMSGGRPAGARDALPTPVALAQLPDGIDGVLPVRQGTYEVVAAHSSLVAKLVAGKEAFDATFTGALTGTLQGDLTKLADPAAPAMAATFATPVAGLDTGIEMRNGHAKGYLKADAFPTISFALGTFSAARLAGPDVLQVRVAGTLMLMGQPQPVTFVGTIKRLDDAARTRLALASPAALLVEGSFVLKVSETGLAAHQDSFDRDELPVIVTIVLQFVA